MSNQPVLVLHGGAGLKKMSNSRYAETCEALQSILETVYPKLKNGGTALEAVALAASYLEDNPLFNAGRGGKIQSDGKIRLSASIMDGARRRFAGCVNVEGVRHPIFLAKALLSRNDRVLSGAGAKAYARELGLEFRSAVTEEQRREFEQRKKGKTGTIGVVALDQRGRLAAATSTGGKGFEYPCRVSDSPTSAGNFATKICAVSATGLGEEIVEFAAASTLCAYVEAGMDLATASKRLWKQVRERRSRFGWIALDRHGEFVAHTTTAQMAWAAAHTQTRQTQYQMFT